MKFSKILKKTYTRIYFYLFGDIIPTSNEELKKLILEQKVLTGVFQGLKYSVVKDLGYGIFPRILGTYELEIRDKVEKIFSGRYDLVIDIGCAEGYYVNGLAYKNPKMNVVGYDIFGSEISYAKSVSQKNGLLNTFFEHRYFDVNELRKILKKFSVDKKKSFIICDIDGAEKNCLVGIF